jgi:competence protein ComFC
MGNRIIKILKYFYDCILLVVYPKESNCVLCEEYNAADGELCKKCYAKIKFCNGKYINKRYDKEFICYSAAYYNNVIMELIIKLKYKGDFTCGDILAKLMVNVIDKEKITFDMITFIPMNKLSYKKREYNQSEYLARIIGKLMNKKVINCLKKVINTKDQIGLNGSLRWENLKDCFLFDKKKIILEKRILLVDDVMTTGATSFYCASLIEKNTENEVIILTAAKSRI